MKRPLLPRTLRARIAGWVCNLTIRRSVSVVCLWTLLFVSWSTHVFGGASIEHVMSDNDLLASPSYSVIVASIEQVDDQGATYGDPPEVTLLVSEVLRGNIQLGRLHARWLPFPHDIDYVGGNSETALRGWEAQPLSGPKQGLKMILIGNIERRYFPSTKYPESTDSVEAFMVSARCRFAYSDVRRAWALKAIQRGEEEDKQEQERQQNERKVIEDKRRQWKEEIGIEEIVRLTREADLIVVGCPGGAAAASGVPITIQVDVLKGIKRESYTENSYSVTVVLPDRVHGILDYNGPEALFFLKENGMNLRNSGWYYPILENGVVYASEESIAAVQDALLNEPGTNARPFCFIHTNNYYPSERQLIDAFCAAGENRCAIAAGFIYMGLPAAEIGRRLTAKAFGGIQLAIVAKLNKPPEWNDAVFEISGLALRGGALEVVEENEIWTANMSPEAMRDKADEFLDRLLEKAKL